MLRKIITRFLFYLFIPILLAVAATCGLNRKKRDKPRLVWGVEGVINDSYFADALKADYVSHSLAISVFSINRRDNFDIVMDGGGVKYVLYILKLLYAYDIHHFSFNGGLLGVVGFGWLEPIVFKLARVKTVVIAYGADVHIYDKIPNTIYANALMAYYPQPALKRKKLLRQVDRWCRHADFVIPSMVISNGFPRWDLVTPSILMIDTAKYEVRPRRKRSSTFKVVHSPNHRIIKGTEYIIAAVEALKAKGLDIELVILEGISNDQVIEILMTEADILVEQIVGPAYAMSGIEGMTCGLPVIGNVNTSDWSESMKLFYRYSFLEECPIVSANPDTIESILEALYENPELRDELGVAGRAYVEKYHSFDAARHLFGKMYDAIWYGKDIDFLNFYHPLQSEFVQNNKVEHPLTRNRLVDQIDESILK